MKKFIKTPFLFGKRELPNNIFYAPLAGCSDFPFRQMNSFYKPGLMFCEMVKMEALLREVPETYRMLAYSEEMRPIGAQLCGSNPSLAGPSAKILEDLGFDVIDLNCGCPVDKVTKDGSGSGLLKEPERIGEILSNIVAAVKVPVSVKIRIGWDDETIVAPEVTKIAEKAGASAITIHGRTRKQAYKGPARWEFIRACKEAATTIKVIGNGDLMEPKDVFRMFEQTGCDGVLIARGMLGRPWFVEEVLALAANENFIGRSLEKCRQALLDHLHFSLSFKSEKGALIDMRRVCCWYLKKVAGAREFRAKASHAQSIEEVKSLIESFDLQPAEEIDEPAEDAAACDC